MINLVLNEELGNKKEIVYALYFLTKDFDAMIKISKEQDENSTNIYYGFSKAFSDGINIPIFLYEKDRELNFNKDKDQFYVSFEKRVDKPFDINDGNIQFKFVSTHNKLPFPLQN